MLSVAILAGGRATRLRPITKDIPKALVDVAGQPFIIRQLKYLKDQGVADVVLCVGQFGEMIKEVVGNGHDIGLNVEYSFDGEKLLGTGGALKNALPKLGTEFFVLYGDSFLPIDFPSIFQHFLQSPLPALMTIYKNNNNWDRSNVKFADGLVEEYDKVSPTKEMSFIDYGLSVLSASVLYEYDTGIVFDLGDVYRKLSFEGSLAGYQVHERFYEIGSHTGLAETLEYFSVREKQ